MAIANPLLLETSRRCGLPGWCSAVKSIIKTPGVARTKKQFKVDRGVMRRSQYRFVDVRELGDGAIPRLCELLQVALSGKYSTYNPQFTENFVRIGA
jgi:hypothetical protein